MLIDNISEVFKRVSHAAMRAGRRPDEIKLVAVTKTVETGKIQEAIHAGLRVFGENRVQEAFRKIEHFKGSPSLRWHLIGSLQKNKARKAVELFDVIESVDSHELLEKINRCAGEIGKRQQTFLQVKLSEEETKHGMSFEVLDAFVEKAVRMEHVEVRGLMTIPPFCENPEDVRPYFRMLREIRDNLLGKGFEIRELSMGMTNDFEVAVEEGATEVRVGTAIFGRRIYH